MPKVSIRLVIYYLIGVGLPLLSLAVVLEVGRSLRPPMHAGGNWTLETGPMCGASSFAVSQTGKRLSITLAEHAAAGTIEGDTVRFSSSQSPCHLLVVARLDRGITPHVIAGEVRAGDCENCPPASFRAVRSAGAGRSQ